MHRVFALRPREAPGEAVHAAGRCLAVRIQNRSDDHREQELDEQQPEAAHLADEPEAEGAGKGRDSRSQLLRSRRPRAAASAPASLEPTIGNVCDPGGRLRDR